MYTLIFLKGVESECDYSAAVSVQIDYQLFLKVKSESKLLRFQESPCYQIIISIFRNSGSFVSSNTGCSATVPQVNIIHNKIDILPTLHRQSHKEALHPVLQRDLFVMPTLPPLGFTGYIFDL